MDVFKQLNIPESCLVGDRIPKTALAKGGDLSNAEKKLLTEEVQDVHWIAAFRPENTGIPAFEDELYAYTEVHYIQLVLKQEKQFKRLASLLQKIIPYPLALWIFTEKQFCLNTADKKINQSDKTRRTVEGLTFAPWQQLSEADETEMAFLRSVKTDELPRRNLKLFYEALMHRCHNLQAAEITGAYKIKTAADTVAEIENLNQYRKMQDSITRLRNELKASHSFQEQVNLNMQLKQLEAETKKLKELMQS